MEHEHEEAMRSDFRERTALRLRSYHPGVTDTQADAIYDTIHQIDTRWESGPHAEHWRYLSDAYSDWERSPEVMTRLMDDIEHNQAEHGSSGVDDLQRRSQIQARDLTDAQRQPRPPRTPVQRER